MREFCQHVREPGGVYAFFFALSVFPDRPSHSEARRALRQLRPFQKERNVVADRGDWSVLHKSLQFHSGGPCYRA
jgi:hypothetical protein